MQLQIELCDREIEKVLQLMANSEDKEASLQGGGKKRKSKNQPRFNTVNYLKEIHKIDVTQIFGISEISALEILSETGRDLSKWATENRFVSWLNLRPNNKITGGKLISSQLLKKKPNAASQAFRMAANSLKQSKNWLGDYFRRMRSKGGQKYAIVATARKLAIIYYKMVRYKQPFTPFNLDKYREKYRLAKIKYLERVLHQLKHAA